MKLSAKIKFFLLVILLPAALWAQDTAGNYQPDEEMDLFLLIFASVFVAAMFGAAIIGALLATLVVLCFAALFSFGILSTSLAIGLYKRSVTAGFKSLLVLFFGTTGAFFGWIGALFFTRLTALQLTSTQAAITGLAAGLAGGVLLALLSYNTLKTILRYAARKFGAA